MPFLMKLNLFSKFSGERSLLEKSEIGIESIFSQPWSAKYLSVDRTGMGYGYLWISYVVYNAGRYAFNNEGQNLRQLISNPRPK